MAKKVIYLGTGAIGSEAQRQFASAGYLELGALNSRRFAAADGTAVEFTNRGSLSEMVPLLEGICVGGAVDLAVFALPSGGKNAAAIELELMRLFLKRNIPVVTAGKAALSEHYDHLSSYSTRLGIDASVGGEVRILKELKDNLRLDKGQDSVVELVLNGTLSYIMSSVWAGRPLETVIREAVRLGFTEPGINNQMPNPLDVFKAEVEGDVPKKIAIILNYVYGELIGRVVRPNEIKVYEFRGGQDLMRLTAGNARRKLVVRISTQPLTVKVESGSAGSIAAEFGGKVFVDGGFCTIPQGSPDDLWIPNAGPGNAVHIIQGRSRVLRGEGAGALATVSTLLFNALKLCPPRDKISSPVSAHQADSSLAR